jgi:endonuclease III
LSEIVGLREKCDGLIEALKEGEGEVGEMLKALGYVEERSESLRGACEDLLEEQVSLPDQISMMKLI